MNSFKAGFIGVGNMGGAILNGILDKLLLEPSDINLYDYKTQVLDSYIQKGCNGKCSEIEVYKNSDIIFLCTKPQDFDVLLEKLEVVFSEDKLIVTIAAGISSSYIKKRIGETAKIIRVMPNAPLMIANGASALSIGENVPKEYKDFVINVFSQLGVVSIIDESLMNEIVCVNGSSPAYVYYFIDAMIKSAVSQGIDKDVAFSLITNVFIGSVNMLLKSKKTPEELIKMVCSPGGTTIESINRFNESGMYEIIDRAMRACTTRAYELGK